MNVRSYKKKVLRKLTKNVVQRHVSVAVICHMATPRVGSVTSFLKEQDDYFLEHPPYSPDIAPVTLFRLPRLKKTDADRK